MMNHFLFFPLFLFVSVLPGLSVQADTSLSIEEATRIALSGSPQLDQSRAQADLSSWSHTEGLSGFLPTLSVGGHYLFDTQVPTFDANFGAFTITSAPSASPSLDAEVTFKLPLFDGLRNVDRFKATSIASQAANLEVDYQSFSLKEQVRLSYFGIIAAENLAVVADQDVKDLEDHRRLVEDQLHAGLVKKVDLLRVDTQLSNAVSEKTNADDEVIIRRQQFAQLLGEEEEQRSIAGELPVPSDATLQSIDNAALGTRSDIQALQMRMDSEDYIHSADSKWWFPSFSFLGAFDAYRSDEARISAYVLGLQLSWNIFDGMASYSRSKESLAQQRIAMRSLQTSVLQAKTDFQTYKRRYRYNLQKYRARVDDVARSQESVRLAKSGFRVGAQTNTDVLDAEQDLFNARANQIQSQYDAEESLVRFELALGRTVSQ